MSAIAEEETVAAGAQRPDVLAWGSVRAGLSLTFLGVLLTLLCPLVFAVIVWALADEKRPSVLALVALGSSVLGLFAGMVLFIAGAGMGCAAPRESGARGWGVGACVCGPLTLVILVLLGMIGLDRLNQHFAEEQRLRQEAELALRPDVKRETISLPVTAFNDGEQQAIVCSFQGMCWLTLACHLLTLRASMASFGRRGLRMGVTCFLLFSLLYLGGVNVLSREREWDEGRLKMLGGLLLGGFVVLQVWYLALAGLARAALTAGLRKPVSL